MRLTSILSFVGFVLLFAGTYCPIIHFGFITKTINQVNQPYGMVLLLVAVIGMIVSFLNQPKIMKVTAWIAMLLVVVLLIAVIFKINTAFSIIPFHNINSWLTSKIKFKWGWWVLFAGPMLALAGALSSKRTGFVKPPESI